MTETPSAPIKAKKPSALSAGPQWIFRYGMVLALLALVGGTYAAAAVLSAALALIWVRAKATSA